MNRVRMAEVQRWRFEVFNEPNCGFYIEGNCCGTGCGDQTGYFQLYQHTANAVKSVSSTLKVSGQACRQGDCARQHACLVHMASAL
ncbi:MAG: hypothetical protein EOO65_04950 [Methanosarcinales archaeon]|nr:MAG: hypothetical protein EOO65_04950 [Methanosarcinales archaeon]